MAYDVRLHDEAEKHLARLDRRMRERILSRIEALQVDPHLRGVEPLAGRPGIFRLRVGQLRIVFRIDEANKIVFVEATTPRGQVYEGRRLQRL